MKNVFQYNGLHDYKGFDWRGGGGHRKNAGDWTIAHKNITTFSSTKNMNIKCKKCNNLIFFIEMTLNLEFYY